jgi:tryptophan-rich sensory protein
MHIFALFAFLIVVLGIGSLIGLMVRPDPWYGTLDKPPFTPPDWVFAPVWTALYVMIAIAGWRIWMRDDWRSRAMMLWLMQMALNFAWTPMFFGAHVPGAALIIIVVLLIAIVGFIRAAWPRDRIAAALFVPYAAWVTFACALNAAIVVLN